MVLLCALISGRRLSTEGESAKIRTKKNAKSKDRDWQFCGTCRHRQAFFQLSILSATNKENACVNLDGNIYFRLCNSLADCLGFISSNARKLILRIQVAEHDAVHIYVHRGRLKLYHCEQAIRVCIFCRSFRIPITFYLTRKSYIGIFQGITRKSELPRGDRL